MDFTTDWTPLGFAFLLLVIYQVKHFLADFPLQREYMLRKTDASWGFLLLLPFTVWFMGL